MDAREVAVEAIPHDIGAAMGDTDLDWEDSLELWFEIYGDMPCYGLLMYLRWWERSAPEEVQSRVWTKFRECLSGTDERLAAPIEYTLWCDYFEDPITVEEIWSRLVTNDASPRLLQRVLNVSGPVPYPLKSSLYERLIGDPSWHSFILSSLVFSQFDYFGQIDREAAKALYQRQEVLTLGGFPFCV